MCVASYVREVCGHVNYGREVVQQIQRNEGILRQEGRVINHGGIAVEGEEKERDTKGGGGQYIILYCPPPLLQV